MAEANLEIDTNLTGGNGSYRVTLSRNWEGVGTPNGGYLATIALRVDQ